MEPENDDLAVSQNIPPPLPATPPPLPEQASPPASHPEERSMVRCEVTGKLIPPEDAVEFRGRTVSAEGKQILLQQLMGGAASGQLIRPGFFRRLFCAILDYVIALFVVIPLTVVVFLLAPDSQSEAALSNAAQIAGAGIIFAYHTLFLGVWGKTLGKMAGGFRVVNLDGSRISWGTAARRAFWAQGVGALPAFFTLVSPTVGALATLLFFLYGLADCIALVVDGDMNRALHDRLAGTRAVMDPGR